MPRSFAAATISGEVSTASIAASGQRRDRYLVRWPGRTEVDDPPGPLDSHP